MENNILDSATFENQIANLNGDDLIKFVAREQYRAQARCARCFDQIEKHDRRLIILESNGLTAAAWGFSRKQLGVLGGFVAGGAFVAGIAVKLVDFFSR